MPKKRNPSTKKKNGHGGKRPGAGRPKLFHKKTTNYSITLVDEDRDYAARVGIATLKNGSVREQLSEGVRRLIEYHRHTLGASEIEADSHPGDETAE